MIYKDERGWMFFFMGELQGPFSSKAEAMRAKDSLERAAQR